MTNKKHSFFSFACGNFIEETVIPDDRTRVSMFSVLGDKLEEQVGKLSNQHADSAQMRPVPINTLFAL
jgi:predicted metalloendopeptidase